MPVRFLLGPAGSGKTHFCLTELRRLERAGRPGIYLVPEQFTYSADRELLSDPSLPGLRHVQVLSFSRLGHRLREETGVPGAEAVSDAVRAMLLRAVLSRLEDAELGAMAALRGRQGLLDQLGRFIAEVRAHGPVSFHEAVRRALDEEPDLGSPMRLRALAAVFELYDRTLHDLGRIDPEESLAGLEALVARRREEVREWTLCVDGFLSWTRREREILVALAAAGARLEIGLCLEESPRAPFAPARRTLAQLRDAFERAGVAVESPLLLDAPAPAGRFRSEQLRRLERGLYAEAPEAPATALGGAAPSVILQVARTPRQEVLLWARTLDRWLRLDSEPCAPQEAAIILRDLAPYRDFIREIFPRYGVPVFLDERRGLLAHPRVRFLLEALEVILSGWRRDAVLTFLRNPLLAIAPAELDLLEILSREYGRDFDAWYAPSWEAYDPGRRARFRRIDREGAATEDEGEEPYGGGAEDEIEEDEIEEGEAAANEAPGDTAATGEAPPPGPEGESEEDESDPLRREGLLLADRLRALWLLPLRAFEESWRRAPPTGPDLVAGLRSLARDLPPGADAREPDPEPEWTVQVEREVAALLEEAARLWDGVAVEPGEFARALRQGCASARVGVTPQRLGQVTVAEVQRSRLHGIRRAIVGGCNDGVLPRAVGEDAILGDHDRRALRRVGLEFGPSAEEKQEEETYFAYIALTRASERLLLTWSRTGEQGESLEPSLLLEEVRRALPDAEAAPAGADPESMETRALQTGAELGGRLVVHLAQTGVEEIAEGEDGAGHPAAAAGGEVPADPLLEELYNRVARAGGPEAGLAAAEPVSAGCTAADPILEARDRLERARPALLYRPEALLEDDVLARLFPDDTIRAGVSRLLEFARCPYQAFAKRMLGLEPKPQAEVTPLETGTLAHSALERFFRAPTGTDRGAIRRRLEEIFLGLQGREEFRAFFVDEASRYRWRSTLQNLERFLRVELARLETSPYKPHAQEIAFGPAWGNAVEIPLAQGRRLLLVGRIDRIDRREIVVAGGSGPTFLGTVVDYKRSPRQGLPGGLERGLDLQLAAYLLFVRDRLAWVPAGGFYAPVLIAPKREEDVGRDAPNPLKIQVHGIYLQGEGPDIDSGSGMLVGLKRGGQSVTPERMEGLLRNGRRFLAAYADGIRSGWIEARPLEEKPGELPCANCDYAAVCRFRNDRDPVRHEPAEGLLLPPEEAP